MRSFTILLFLAVCGCSSTPYAPPQAGTNQSVLATTHDEDGDQKIYYRFERCGARRLDSVLSLEAHRGKGYRVEAGVRRLVFSVMRSPKGLFPQHGPVIGGGITEAVLKPGHRYRIVGRYIPRQMVGYYQVVDFDPQNRQAKR